MKKVLILGLVSFAGAYHLRNILLVVKPMRRKNQIKEKYEELFFIDKINSIESLECRRTALTTFS